MQISRKRFEIETWYRLPTNRKWPMADRTMTSLMANETETPSTTGDWKEPLIIFWVLGLGWVQPSLTRHVSAFDQCVDDYRFTRRRSVAGAQLAARVCTPQRAVLLYARTHARTATHQRYWDHTRRSIRIVPHNTTHHTYRTSHKLDSIRFVPCNTARKLYDRTMRLY